MRTGDIVKCRNAVDVGDEDVRMVLLEVRIGPHPESVINSFAAILQI